MELTQATIMIPQSAIIIDYKEAMIFAFLVLLRLQNKTSVLSTVMGAEEDHSSGELFMQEN